MVERRGESNAPLLPISSALSNGLPGTAGGVELAKRIKLMPHSLRAQMLHESDESAIHNTWLNNQLVWTCSWTPGRPVEPGRGTGGLGALQSTLPGRGCFTGFRFTQIIQRPRAPHAGRQGSDAACMLGCGGRPGSAFAEDMTKCDLSHPDGSTPCGVRVCTSEPPVHTCGAAAAQCHREHRLPAAQ